MKLSILFYLAAFAVVAFTFFFIKAYHRAVGYNNLINQVYDAYIGFQHLSQDINKAVSINPDSGKIHHSSDVVEPYYTDSASIVRQLNSLKFTIQDSVSSFIVKELDRKLLSELPLLDSNGANPGIYNKTTQRILKPGEINALLDQGINRSLFLLTPAKNQLNEAILEIKIWIAICFGLLIALLVFAIFYISRQKVKTSKQGEHLEITNRLLKSAQSIAKLGNWNHNIPEDSISWSDEVYKIWGMSKDTPVNYRILTAAIHPDYRDRFNAEQLASYTGVKESDFEYQIILPDNTLKWIHQQGKITSYLNSQPRIFEATVQDITQRKEIEIELSRNAIQQSLLVSLVKSSDDAIISKTLDGVITTWNKGAETIFGYTAQEATGRHISLIIPTDRLNEETRIVSKISAGQYVEHYETKRIRKDGSFINISLSVSPVRDSKGNIIGASKIARDITARKNEELRIRLLAEISRVFNESPYLNQVLNLATERLVNFDDFATAEIWLVGKEQNLINFIAGYPGPNSMLASNEGSGNIKSFPKGQGLPGISWQKKVVQFWQNIAEDKDLLRGGAIKKQGIYSAYGLPIIFNNEVMGVLILGLLKNGQGNSAFVSSFENLGFHLGAEIKRKQLEQELSQIFNSAPDIICIAGLDGYFKMINPAASNLLEYAEDELLGVPYSDFIHPADRAETIAEFGKMAGEPASFYIENRCLTKSGKIKWLAWTSSRSKEEGLIFSVAKDITGKKELENLLTKANTMARMGGWEIDLLNNTVYWTDMAKDIHEVNTDYVPDLKAMLNFYKEGPTRELYREKVSESIEYGKAWDEELQIVTGKGNGRWIRTIGEAEFVKSKCVRIYGSFQDIDQRKRTEIGLQKTVKSLEHYQFAIDQSFIISITEQTGKISHVNHNLTQISKYCKEELIGKTNEIFRSGYHPPDFFSELWRTIESGKVWRHEIKNKTKDGSYYWIDTTIVPFLGNDNKPLQYLSIGFDVTGKKLAIENEIRILNEKNTILESIGDAFFAVDSNWVVTYWNQIAEKVLWKPKNEIIGQCLWDMFPNSRNTESYKMYQRAMETSQVVHFEDFQRTQEKWYEISAYPSDNGLSVYFKDITYRKVSEIRLTKLNEDLKEQAKQLEYSNKELEQFAYVASHDLQEPLRMVTGFLTKLDQKYHAVFDDTAKKYIHFAVDGARRMGHVILDLLEFSKVGRSAENKETFDLNEIVNEIKMLLGKQINEKKAVIEYAHLPVVEGYKAPLRQVFQNLVSNALKYAKNDTPPHVVITTKESSDHWEFGVSDNGIGIEQQYFERIFVIFQRLHTKEEYSGTGIGLAITKKIVESMGGNIWLESIAGKGCTFYFTILKN